MQNPPATVIPPLDIYHTLCLSAIAALFYRPLLLLHSTLGARLFFFGTDTNNLLATTLSASLARHMNRFN